MSADQTQKATIKVESLNAVLKYLAARPYQEVAGLIPLVQEAELVQAPVPVKDLDVVSDEVK